MNTSQCKVQATHAHTHTIMQRSTDDELEDDFCVCMREHEWYNLAQGEQLVLFRRVLRKTKFTSIRKSGLQWSAFFDTRQLRDDMTSEREFASFNDLELSLANTFQMTPEAADCDLEGAYGVAMADFKAKVRIIEAGLDFKAQMRIIEAGLLITTLAVTCGGT